MMQYERLNLTIQPISKDDTKLYKGFAILAIMLHNFLHLLPPETSENEMDFLASRVTSFINIITTTPEYVPQALASFLGHYAVQIFIFLSAYGLTVSYSEKKTSYFPFLKKRLLKIYPAFIFSIVVYLIYIGFLNDGFETVFHKVRYQFFQFVYKLTFVSNYIKSELHSLNGPWWFISFIAQFYILFPFIIFLFRKFGNITLWILSAISVLSLLFIDPIIDIKLAGTIFGHFPEACLGILLASSKKINIPFPLLLITVFVFIFSCSISWMWPLSYLSILIIQLILYQKIKPFLPSLTHSIFSLLGTISMYLFLINGFMRNPWVSYAETEQNWSFTLLMYLLFLSATIALAYLMEKSETYIRQKIVSKSN